MGQATQKLEDSLIKRPLTDIFGSIFLFAAAFALAALPIWVFTNDGFTWRAICLAIAQAPIVAMCAWAGFTAGWGALHAPNQEQRELDRLTRPVRWAGYVSLLGVGMAFMMWRDNLLILNSSTVVLISLLGMVAAFSLWGVNRVTDHFWSK